MLYFYFITRLFSAFTLFILLILAGCHGSTDVDFFEIHTVADGLPDAENVLITRSGRLFVSAWDGLYEITQSGGGGLCKDRVLEGSCNFRGLAEFDDTLYAACQDGLSSHLVAYDLASDAPSGPEPYELYSIHEFERVFFPNGIAADEEGRLYINDMVNLSPGLGRIVRIEVDHGTWQIADEYVWLDFGLLAPNGMAYVDGSLVVTDLWNVKRIPIRDETYGAPPRAEIIYSRPTHIFDDLAVKGDEIVVADFTNGSVFAIDASGEVVWETPPEAVPGPSAVELGQRTPLFSDNAVIVTAIGTLFEQESTNGNSLIYFLVPE